MNFPRRQALRLFSFAFGSALLPAAASLQSAAQSAKPAAPTPAGDKEKVAGIGGFFFRAKDPAALTKWYEEHLGITPSPTTMQSPVWNQQAGPTLFTPFPETTHYFGDETRQWMMNFRVHNLDKLAAQLTAAGIAVKMYPPSEPGVKFARIHDPEGNPIELWQPA
jgi:predicted enzyme related to lactoylglutathione lyase